MIRMFHNYVLFTFGFRIKWTSLPRDHMYNILSVSSSVVFCFTRTRHLNAAIFPQRASLSPFLSLVYGVGKIAKGLPASDDHVCRFWRRDPCGISSAHRPPNPVFKFPSTAESSSLRHAHRSRCWSGQGHRVSDSLLCRLSPPSVPSVAGALKLRPDRAIGSWWSVLKSALLRSSAPFSRC